MSKDLNATGRWLRKITQSLAAEPQDRAELIEQLRDANQRNCSISSALS